MCFALCIYADRIGGAVSKTVAAMDLGGGSTQITVASSPETQSLYPKEDIQNISLFHKQVPLYTHRFAKILNKEQFRKCCATIT